MGQLQKLGIKSFTVVANDEHRANSLKRAIAGCVVAAGLAVGGIADAKASDGYEPIPDTQSQLTELLAEARDNASPSENDLVFAKHSHLIPDLYKKDRGATLRDTTVDIIRGKGAYQSEQNMDVDHLLSDSAKVGIKAGNIAGTAYDVTRAVMNPELTASAYVTKLGLGSATAAATNNSNHGLHIASAVTGLATATTLGPVGIGLYAASQTYNTYQHVQMTREHQKALGELRVAIHLEAHDRRVDQYAMKSYSSSRAEWADMPQADRQHRHERYVDAATEYLLNPTEKSWIGDYIDMESRAGAATNEYLPWFVEAVSRAHDLKTSMATESTQDDKTNGPANDKQASSVDSLNALTAAMGSTLSQKAGTSAGKPKSDGTANVNSLNSLMAAMSQNASSFTISGQEAAKHSTPRMG